MAESTLSVDYAKLVRAAAKKLGTGLVYSNGTISVSSGVVTITSGTWPSWAATGVVNIAGNYYGVSTRDSSTQLTLTDTTVNASGPVKYVLLQTLSDDKEDAFRDIDELIDEALRRFYFPNPLEGQKTPHQWSFLFPVASNTTTAGESIYALADDCGDITKDWTVEVGNEKLPLAIVGEGQLRSIFTTSTESLPKYLAIRRSKLQDDGAGQRYEVMFDRPFNGIYTLQYRYQILPSRLTPDNPHPYGGMRHSETIRASVLASAEKYIECSEGMYAAEFQKRLAASIQLDVESANAEAVSYHTGDVTLGTYQWFQQELSAALGMNPNYRSWNHTDKMVVDGYIQRGLRLFYNPPLTAVPTHRAHRWSFLRPVIEINLHGAYSTGTVAIASGLVTLSSGVFPDWAEGATLIVSGIGYRVAKRNNSTSLTITDTEASVSAGATYSLQQTAYPFPIDALSIDGPLHYRRSSSTYWNDIKLVDESTIRRLEQNSIDATSNPVLACITLAADQSAGTKRQIRFWPAPDTTYTVIGNQRITPGPFSSGVPYGGSSHYNAMLYAMLASADEKKYWPLFLEHLQASIELDQAECSSESVGLNLDRGFAMELDGEDMPRRYSSFTNNL